MLVMLRREKKKLTKRLKQTEKKRETHVEGTYDTCIQFLYYLLTLSLRLASKLGTIFSNFVLENIVQTKNTTAELSFN